VDAAFRDRADPTLLAASAAEQGVDAEGEAGEACEDQQ
jgi:hypothetical protein